jgi:hypothetical protein
MPRPGRTLPPGKNRYPLYRRLCEPPGPIWVGEEILAPVGIRSPDRPARSESLYRLRCASSLLLSVRMSGLYHNSFTHTPWLTRESFHPLLRALTIKFAFALPFSFGICHKLYVILYTVRQNSHFII